ncbi:Acid phosphatase-like protein 2 [Dissophora globulifera]|uniref:Acid phosphatase-like protein 2 n=1 Tax=Dissophora globulifera TaxID=979702 RepID=A0A9P6RGL8_9FUNG|nr:Acid phosphatase-like protein 2 [Dissophora globulifera]
MILEPRLSAVLLVLTTGGLFFSASRWSSSSVSQPLALDILDQADHDNDGGHVGDYNYCQAQRPTQQAYPAPKVCRTPTAVQPLDLDLTWECSNTTAYAFTGLGTDMGEKSPFQYASVVAHHVITIPPVSPFAATHMWKGSCLPGQLTPVGAMQHRKLGAALRSIYVDEFKLLPLAFDPDTVHIRSTDVWRTRQSAENFMAGLYGIQGHDTRTVSPPVLQIHTLPTEIDYLTMNGGACPQLRQLRSTLEKSSDVLKRLREDNVEFNQQLVEVLGSQMSWSGYMDTVQPRICHGHPLQCRDNGECITHTMASKIIDNVNVQTAEVYRDGEGILDVLQLGIGPLTSDIKQNLLAASGNGKIRFHFYSGHDTTILPMLGMLDSTDLRWPPYASNLLIELWKSPSGENYVRVLYNNAIIQTKSEWCDLEWCPLKTFVDYLDRFIVKDLTKLCQMQ